MKKLNLLLAGLLISAAAFTQSNRIYVHAAAAGAANGLSWTDAYPGLQSALAVAVAGDTIWIAEGVYYPTTSTDRSLSFEPQSGVCIFGGFAGSESALAQRDWSAHPVILSGDIGVQGDSTDNSYNVAYLFHPDSNTVLDGLVFRDGVANNSAGANSTRSRLVCGGGLYIMADGAEAYPEIRNCRFEHNTAQYTGAGAMINAINNGSAAPRWINCVFEDNNALSNGGGLAKIGASFLERGADLDGCIFRKNRSNSRGGGLYYMDSNGNDEIGIENCRFEENVAYTSGGGAYFLLGRAGKSFIGIHKSDFLGNISGQGAAITFFSNGGLFDGPVKIDGCIFRNNNSMKLNPNNSYFNIIHGDLLSTSQSTIHLNEDVFEQNTVTASRILELSFSNPGKTIIENSIFKNNDSRKLYSFASIYENIIKNTIFRENIQNIIGLHSKVYKIQYLNCSFMNEIAVNPLSIEFTSATNFIDTCILENCTLYNNAFNPKLLIGELDIVYMRNTFIKNVPLAYLQLPNCKTYISNCYLPGFDCGVQDPNVICEGGIITAGDPMFMDTLQGDFRLQPCSPLINAGNNGFVSSSSDIAGAPRIQEGTVDIGAYEAPAFALAMSPGILPACSNSPGGAISLSPANGCLPYTYHWSPPAGNGPNIDGLLPGDYSFTVTDASGRSLSDTLSVSAAPSPQADILADNIQCSTGAGGSALVLASNGTAPYTYQWSNGASGSQISMLQVGLYTVSVTDALGCEGIASLKMSLEGNLTLMVDGQSISCFGAADGTLSATAVTGAAPFSYQWSPSGSMDSLRTDLGPGLYSITVSDVYGCTATFTFTLSDPPLLQASATAMPANSLQVPNGIATAGVSGGTPAHSYAWSNGGSASSISGLAPGTYTVTVTDAHGCTATAVTEVKLVSGTHTLADLHVQVGPNPMREWLELLAQDLPAGQYRFLLYDALGREVAAADLRGGKAVLWVQALPAGAYIWTLEAEAEVLARGKVIR